MKKATITVYDKKGKPTRTVEAEPLRLTFGHVRRLTALMDQSNDADTVKSVLDAWDEVQDILGQCFPDLTPEELDSVDFSEIVRVLVQIITSAMEEMGKGQPKN